MRLKYSKWSSSQWSIKTDDETKMNRTVITKMEERSLDPSSNRRI